MVTNTFSVRADARTQHELDELTKHAESRNDAVNEAIHLAYRRLWQERMRSEALGLVNDPEDRAEMDAIRSDMDELRAW